MWIVEIYTERDGWRSLCRPLGGVRYTYASRYEADLAARGTGAAMGKQNVRVRRVDA